AIYQDIRAGHARRRELRELGEGALLGPHRRPEPGCHLHSGDTRPCTQVHPKPLDSWTPAAFLLLGSHLHWGCRHFLAGSNGSMTLGRTVGSVKSNADRARGHQRENGRGAVSTRRGSWRTRRMPRSPCWSSPAMTL